MSEEQKDKKTTDFKPGMVVKVHQKIKEMNTKGEEKERIQIYEGTIIAVRHGKEAGATITVRKISEGVGVEKIFPIYSPVVPKIEVLKQLKVRRSKLYHLRDPKFKRRMAEIKEPKKAK
ncbi:50S ribosomal protein L19 [Patescibacteria group bacterium]|nr:50S ribosomal protein L19 [Patescibacteria group bacterium]MBU1613436.1 50S ribosomal protein L19 [Patescibacteria group bacterium]